LRQCGRGQRIGEHQEGRVTQVGRRPLSHRRGIGVTTDKASDRGHLRAYRGLVELTGRRHPGRPRWGEPDRRR
jgi:hypothetical protein